MNNLVSKNVVKLNERFVRRTDADSSENREKITKLSFQSKVKKRHKVTTE